MQNTKPTSRELYNSLWEFEQYLVDNGYLSIIDWVFSMQPKLDCKMSFQQMKQWFTEKMKRDRKNWQNK